MPTARKYESDAEARQVLANGLKDLPIEFLMCRDPGIRHPWEVTLDFHITDERIEGRRGNKARVIARHSRCARCGTVKQEDFMVSNVAGLEKIANRYYYPEKYQIPGVPRGVKPSAMIWSENYSRALKTVLNEQIPESSQQGRLRAV